MMTDAHGIARDQLRSFIERIERLSEEKKAIADDIKDVYAEAKGTGFDVKTIKRIVALRKKSEDERSEEEALLDTYMSALGMIQRDLFDSDTGEIISTSAGDSDLTPAAAARGSEESAAFNSPETANQTPKQVYGDSAALATAAPSQSVDIPAGGENDQEGDGQTDACPAEPNSTRPASLAGSGGDRSIQSSNDGSAKMGDLVQRYPGRADGKSDIHSAEFEQATNNSTMEAAE